MKRVGLIAYVAILAIALGVLVYALFEFKSVDSTALVHPESRVAQAVDREHTQDQARQLSAAEQRAATAEHETEVLRTRIDELRAAPEPEPISEPEPITEPIPEPEPPGAMYYAPCDTDLHPLEGWNDQPKRDRPGRIHTNLRIRHGKMEPCEPAYGTFVYGSLGTVVVGPNPRVQPGPRTYRGAFGTLTVHPQ
jgi:hypothetical protein